MNLVIHCPLCEEVVPSEIRLGRIEGSVVQVTIVLDQHVCRREQPDVKNQS